MTTITVDEFPTTLGESLVRALGSMSNVVRGDEAKIPGKEGKAGYSYRYADLGDLLTAVRPILAAQGLAISQGCTNDGRQVSVITTILHWSGASMVTEALSLPGAGTPQAVGSAITYARRYQLMAVLGLASDDDDGQQAAATPYREPRREPAPPSAPVVGNEPPDSSREILVPLEAPRLDDPDRVAAVGVFKGIQQLHGEAMSDFRAWLSGRPVSVPAMTADPDWCVEVATKVFELTPIDAMADADPMATR